VAENVLERLDVLEVERIARVILGNEEHAARVGAHALDRCLDRLHAQRKKCRIQVVEAAGEEIRVDGRELESRVAQIDGRIERNRVLLPLRAYPALDIGHPLDDALLELLQRAGEGSREVGNHGGGECRGIDCSGSPAHRRRKKGAPMKAPRLSRREKNVLLLMFR
jgi:hypothetical protein